MSPWDVQWNEPDGEVLDALTRQACFAADMEALKPRWESRIWNPDGSAQFETEAERTRRIVRAVLRMVLANGLVTAVPPEDWPEYTATEPPGAFLPGGSMRQDEWLTQAEAEWDLDVAELGERAAWLMLLSELGAL